MGFNLKFWKKRDDLDALKEDILKDAKVSAEPDPLSSSVEQTNLGVSNTPQQSFQEPFQQRSFQQQSFNQNPYSNELFNKNLEVISAKLDAIKVSIDSLNQRITNLEQQVKNRW